MPAGAGPRADAQSNPKGESMASKPLKTQPTTADVDEFLAGIADADRRAECLRLRTLMEQLTGEPARMWGAAMVGFGRYRYVYESGREGEWFRLGFSPPTSPQF